MSFCMTHTETHCKPFQMLHTFQFWNAVSASNTHICIIFISLSIFQFPFMSPVVASSFLRWCAGRRIMLSLCNETVAITHCLFSRCFINLSFPLHWHGSRLCMKSSISTSLKSPIERFQHQYTTHSVYKIFKIQINFS